MKSIRSTFGAALVALATTTSILSGSPASAGIVNPDYQHVDAFYQFDGQAYAGNYLSCPAGTQALAGGATLNTTYGSLINGVTTFDGTGVYESAFSGHGDGVLQVSARCVNAKLLAGNNLVSSGLREHRSGWHSYVRSATCPTGTVPYGGGGWVNTAGGTVDLQGLEMFGSFPTATGWSTAMTGDLGTSRTLWVSSHCLPRTKLGKLVTVTETVPTPDGPDLQTVFAGARWPEGYFAFAGGAWFHPEGVDTPDWRGYLWISNMAADDRGWFALGKSFRGDAEFTTSVTCTNRLR